MQTAYSLKIEKGQARSDANQGNFMDFPKIFPDLKDVRLTHSEYKLFRFIRKKQTVFLDEAQTKAKKFKQENACLRLLVFGLIQEDDETFAITQRGLLWYDYYKTDKNKERLKTVMNIVTILISLTALIVSMIK